MLPATALHRIVGFSAVVIPFVGFLLASIALWQWGFSWVQLAVFVAPFLLTSMGITIGYHRLFTHRAFETYAPVKAVLAVLGSMAVEGPLLQWVATHRRHHQCSDHEGDPHSPHDRSDTTLGLLYGFYYAHIGWMMRGDVPALGRYVGDLRSSRMLTFISKTFPIWVLLGLLIPAALAGIITGTWTGALIGFLWGGMARVFFVHHVTWSINSACHLWGNRPYETGDESRNNVIFGVLALGEGWHNNHHAFPNSARHGLRWWQLDISYLIIRLMGLLGLAWDIKTPSQHSMDQMRAKAA